MAACSTVNQRRLYVSPNRSAAATAAAQHRREVLVAADDVLGVVLLQ
jgi:hypothetical protein